MKIDRTEKDRIIHECRSMMSEEGYGEAQIEQFCSITSDFLTDCIAHSDEQRDIEYRLKKRINRIELRIRISGEEIDPFTDGKGAGDRRLLKIINDILFNQETTVGHYYRPGWNNVVIRSSCKNTDRSLWKQPMVQAVLLGIIAGILCRFLPAGVCSTVLEEITAPVMDALMKVMMGVMKPVIFMSLMMSVSALESMEEFTRLGTVVLKRFVLVILFITIVSIAVALLFFRLPGEGSIRPDVGVILEPLLNVFPTNFAAPFTEGTIPQIILMAVAAGAALLMMGDRAKSLRDMLELGKEWVMELMGLMVKVMPLLPFLSTCRIVALGDAGAFFRGWKYIAAAYLCFVLCVTVKFIKVSARCSLKIPEIWRRISSLVKTVFVSAVPQAALGMSYTVSEKEFGIDPSFSAFWIPLGYNILIPSNTVGSVLAVFFIADLAGIPATASFLLVLVLLAVPLSLASPEMIPAVTILLQSLGMPADYIGLFSAFGIFTRNAGAAFDTAYIMLEQIEAAHVTGRIDPDRNGRPDASAPEKTETGGQSPED